MIRSIAAGLFLLVVVACPLASVRAQEASPSPGRVAVLEGRVSSLERKVRQLPNRITVDHADGAGLVLFLYGCFCALWAQNTNRNPWLWFFLGLFFSVITAVVLLSKNAGDRQRSHEKPPGSGLEF